MDAQALDSLAGDTTTTLPFGGGLLMFDGNPPRLTQIGFDLSRIELGHNTQMETFSRSAPRVAPIVLGDRPVGIWLTVFPGTDNSQGNTLHQLYACALDVADPAAMRDHASRSPRRGSVGYGIAQAPIAAAAMPDGRYLRRRPQRRGQPDLAARRGHDVRGGRGSGLASRVPIATKPDWGVADRLPQHSS